MTHHIVTWSDNDIYYLSPVLSSTTFTLSLDSTMPTFSYTYPSHSQISPTAIDAPGLPSAEIGAKHASIPGSSREGKTSSGRRTTPDNSFIEHDAYFFKDGNVTFLVDGTLYCVHRYFFSRDSVYFSTRFNKLGIRDHEALPTIILIGDVKRKDFEALLSILYPTNFEAHELSYEQWKSVLHLSTHWGFASLRKLALNSIKPPTPHDQLILARTYSVDHWVLPSLTALCSRTPPISLGEARQMSMEDVILVATVREEIRGGVPRVDVADIPRYVAKAEAKADAEAKAKAEADEEAGAQKAKHEVDGTTKPAAQETKLCAEVKAIARANPEAEANATTEVESQEKREACAKATAEVEARKKAEAEAREDQEAEAEADAKDTEGAKVKAAEEAKAAAAKEEFEVKQRVEKERLEIDVKSNRDAEAAKAELCARQAEEQIARSRAAEASSPKSPARGSSGGWLSKITSVAASAREEPAPPSKSTSPWNSDPWARRHVKNVSSPSTVLGPIKSPGGPRAPVQQSSTTCSPRGSVSTHHATSITAVPSSASVVSSALTLMWPECKPTNDKQDGKASNGKTAVATDDGLSGTRPW